MLRKERILSLLKAEIKTIAPGAKAILFGSYARNEQTDESDIDLLILIDKETITYEDETKISFPLFMIGIKEGVLVSSMIYSKNFWENKHKVTPFYESVKNEGIVL